MRFASVVAAGLFLHFSPDALAQARSPFGARGAYGGWSADFVYDSGFGIKAPPPVRAAPRAFGYESTDGFGYAPGNTKAGFVWRYPAKRVPEEEKSGSAPPDPGAREQIESTAMDSELAEGRRRWRMADAASGLAAFKQAVVADTRHGPAQAHMALALLATGDGRNADKALKSAAALMDDVVPLASIPLKDCWRDAKELAKFRARLELSANSPGALTAGFALLLLGDRAKAADLLGKLSDREAVRLAALAK